MMPDSTRAAWDRIAPGYDRTNTRTQMWLGNESLRRAGLRSGMRFLDVAAGSGALSIPAARLGARVLATDQSPVMLRLLEERSRKEALDIETRVMDGHALELDDGSFDMAGSQFGVMLFPDMPKGIREMARVTRSSGLVLLNVYGPPQRIEFLAFLVRAIQSVRPQFMGPPMDPVPLPFQLQDPEDGKALWDWLICSNPIVGSVLGCLGLTGEETGMVQQALEKQVRERSGGTGRRSSPTPYISARGSGSNPPHPRNWTPGSAVYSG
jgi:SAM-dependent methyltransferase